MMSLSYPGKNRRVKWTFFLLYSFFTTLLGKTGATQTFVTPIFAEILGVPDVRQGRWVKVSRIKAGPLELKDLRIAIWDTLDNLIGMGLLQYVNFTIDYQAGVIRWNL